MIRRSLFGKKIKACGECEFYKQYGYFSRKFGADVRCERTNSSIGYGSLADDCPLPEYIDAKKTGK